MDTCGETELKYDNVVKRPVFKEVEKPLEYPKTIFKADGIVIWGLNVLVGKPAQATAPVAGFAVGVLHPAGNVVGTEYLFIFIEYLFALTKNSA